MLALSRAVARAWVKFERADGLGVGLDEGERAQGGHEVRRRRAGRGGRDDGARPTSRTRSREMEAFDGTLE